MLPPLLPPRALWGILKADGLRLVRDRFLHGMAGLILGMCVALRWGLPWVTSELQARWQFDLTPWHPLLAGHIAVVLPTVTVGILGGFILLESREDRVIKALLVVPVSLTAYLWVIGTVMALFCAGLAFVHAAIIGLALPPWPALAGIALATSTAAPAKALFQAGYADNKIEAVAFSKIVSAAAPIALGAYFVPEPWQWLAGVYPPYWAAKAYWVAEAREGAWWLWALGAPVASAFWLVLMGRKFQTAARR